VREKRTYNTVGANNNPEVIVEEKVIEDDGYGGKIITIKDKVYDKNEFN